MSFARKMTNKEAITVLNMIECHNPLSQDAKDLAIHALGVCDKIKAIIDGWAVDDDEHELLERIADIVGGEEE